LRKIATDGIFIAEFYENLTMGESTIVGNSVKNTKAAGKQRLLMGYLFVEMNQ
jgi:hypothetical protein